MKEIVLGAFADEAGAALSDQIAAMKDNGIRHLEARTIGNKNFSDFTIAEARAVKNQLDANDLRIWSIGSPLGKIGITAPMEPHLDKLKHTIELGQIMGSEYIRMFSFYLPAGEDPAVYRDEVMERLERMTETAKGSGIRLCHENEKGIYGDVASRCADILEQIPELGGIFDPANFIQCGQDTLQAWEQLKERMVYFHVKDCTKGGKVVPCGKGIGHVPEILHRFIDRGGWQLTVEPHLTVFPGFADLEKEDAKTKMASYEYPSQRAAFDAAVAALKEVL